MSGILPCKRNTLGTIQKIYNFLEASPKCHAVLHIIKHEGTSLELTLKSQSITRWSCRLSRLLWNSFLVKALLLLAEEKDLKTYVESKCLLTAICDFDFEVLKIILSNTDSLSKYLQGEKMDIVNARGTATSTITTLSKCRTDNAFDDVWLLSEQISRTLKTLLKAHYMISKNQQCPGIAPWMLNNTIKWTLTLLELTRW